jgi:hypothetical protein
MSMKKTLLSTAVAGVLGASAMAMPTNVSADIIEMTWSGHFTMINPTGTGAQVNADSPGDAWYGLRSDVSGTMTFNTSMGTGTGTVVPFSFFGGGAATASSITFVAIGNGGIDCGGPGVHTSTPCGPGTLVLGNMGFTWGPTTGIPVSLVMDAAGMFGALGAGVSVSSNITGGTFAATENFDFNPNTDPTKTKFLPMGAGPVVSTTWNTTTIAPGTVGTNPSGTLPLITDSIGGTPMPDGPFPANNANFDIMSIHVTNIIPDVPIPAAVWLFGSGLLGLAGIARRRKKA